MTDDMEEARHPAEPDPDAIERTERVRTAYRKLAGAALYLPSDLRQRIESIGNMVQEAYHVSFGYPIGNPCHYDSPYTTCQEAKQEARAAVAAFVKDEPLPKAAG